MKETIKIDLDTQNSLTNLIPMYDREAGLLAVTSVDATKWTYGIDIDGTIIFDLNKSYVVENIDVLISSNLWKVNDIVKKPEIKGKARVKIKKESVVIKSFNYSKLVIYTNSERSAIKILFDENSVNYQGIMMSERCVALVEKNALLGLYIDGIVI